MIKGLSGYNVSIAAITTFSANDIPCAGDFLDQGKAQPAVYRPSTGTLYIYNNGGTPVTKTISTATGDQFVLLPYSIRQAYY